MSKTLPIFRNLTSLQNRSYIATDSLGGTYRVYPRHNIHCGRLLCDCGFENTYFTVLNEFHVENITYFFEVLTSLQNRSYIATGSLGGTYRVYPRHNIHSGRLLWDREFENTYFTVLKEFHVEIIT